MHYLTMPLRKALILTSTLANNAGSFVNQTARRLHIRKTIGTIWSNGNTVIGDVSQSSLDEVPVQQIVDDSRSHIDHITLATGGGTGGIGPTIAQRAVLNWNREDLVLDPDEALFVNTIDVAGAQPTASAWNLFYQD